MTSPWSSTRKVSVHRAAMELPAASPAEMREVVVECIGEDDQSHVIARIPLAGIR